MKKRIAVFICAISFDNQRKILEGIINKAKESNVDVFVFTCYLNYLDTHSNKQGAYQIMELPDLSRFDGAIIAKNTIQYEAAVEKLMKRIKDSGIPAVCTDELVPDMDSVGISDYEAQKNMVNHLLDFHKVSNIFYVTGHITNTEGMDRFLAYKDALLEHGIPYQENRVYYGNYDIDSGRWAVKEFVRRGQKPEAIVCANDNMAIGVIEELREHGYSVPEDVLVTGFDNDEMSEIYNPPLATVERNQRQIGYAALERVLDGMGNRKVGHVQVEAEVFFRKSCGCEACSTWDYKRLKEEFVKKMSISNKAIDCIRNMTSELMVLEELSEFYHVLQKYVATSDMDAFYLCICEDETVFHRKQINFGAKIDMEDVNQEYTEYVNIPLAYKDGKFVEIGRIPSGDVLPESELEQTGSDFYVVSPVNYRNCCYGYCVSKNSFFSIHSELYYSWTMNLGIGLENIRKWILINKMVKELNGVWAYDMLTHLYNRAGFFHYAKELLKKVVKTEGDVFLIFMDMDGLKAVNDNLGHESGDRYIADMAEILVEAAKPENLVMRYGGDEFVVFGSCVENREAEKCVERIRCGLSIRNSAGELTYRMDASIGYSTYHAADIINLSEVLEAADQKMYQEKKEKKRREVLGSSQ